MPKAYGYCRLSKDETTVKCSACQMEWSLKITDAEQTEFDCPFCQHTFTMDREDPISIQAQADTTMKLFHSKCPRSLDPDVEIAVDLNISRDVPLRDRPEAAKLLRKLRSGDYLIVARLDRMFTDLEDCSRQLKFFVNSNVKLILGDYPDLDITSWIGRMFVQWLAMFAECELQRIRERTKATMQKRKALGLPVNGQAPRGYAVMCTRCQHKYSHAETAKGQACPGCKIPRRGNTAHIPDPNEQQLMWRILWERSAYCWKDWDMVCHDLNVDGHRTRQGRKITESWARKMWYSAVELLYDEKLLVEHRPPKMENFAMDKIPHIPKAIAERMEEQSRELVGERD